MTSSAQRREVTDFDRALAGVADQTMTPKARLSVSGYAAKKRFVQPGIRYSLRKTPFWALPMDCMEPGKFRTIAMIAPGQAGKTTGPENFLLHSIENSPGDFLWYMQSDDSLKAYVKKTIDPMIDLHPDVRALRGLKAVDDSLGFKRFRTLTVEFLTAAMSNLINKRAPRIVADEIDAWDKELGDPKVLLDVRRSTFGAESILIAMSHPDRGKGLKPETDWTEGILAIYADSDRRVWWWPCPHCGAFSSPCPTASRVMSLEYDTQIDLPPDPVTGEVRARLASLDEVEASAHLRCPVNDCKIADRERRAMNLKGFWAGDGQVVAKDGTITGTLVKRKTAGFWAVGAMNTMGDGIGAMARARVKAEREFLVSGEDKTLREVMTKVWGFPYTPPRNLGSVTANELAERAEPGLKLGVVPDGVRFLTCAVDVQSGFFEYLVRGWGVDGESWVVARGRILADPATNPADWDRLLALFGTFWPLADGSGRSMGVRASCIDSGGEAGVTQQAYAAWRRWRDRKIVRHYGKVGGPNGRDVFNIMLTKGGSKPNQQKLAVVYPDTQRAANQAAARGEIPVAIFNPNLYKDDLLGQLLRVDPGPFYVHFPGGQSPGAPYGLKSESGEAPHPWFEQLVAEGRLPNGTWQRLTPSARNEALDLMVLNHVLAHIHGMNRIKWDRPTVWAAPWDFNPMVRAAPSTPPEGGPQTPGPGAPPAPAPAPTVQVRIEGQPKPSIGKRLA